MSVQVLLTADNHLDPPVVQFGPRRVERKADYQRSFEAVVEYALQNRPDVFLIAGDLHDSIQPRNPPRAKIVSYFKELHKAGVPVYLIGGHHDTPRGVEQQNSPLAVYGSSGYATFFQDQKSPESVSINISGRRLVISGISYDPDLSPDEDPLSRVRLKPDGDMNIFMFHYPVEGFRGFYGNESHVRAASLPSGFQLIAAGHLHQHQKRVIRGTPVIYPGSTERKSFLEEGEEKGFVWLELDEEGLQSEEFVKTPSRRMKTLDFKLPQEGDITRALMERIEQLEDPDLILRVRLLGRMNMALLPSYRRPALLSRFSTKFFFIEFDDGSMEIMTRDSTEALPRTTPLEELRRYFRKMIGEAKKEEREHLQDALALCEQLLQEAGAW